MDERENPSETSFTSEATTVTNYYTILGLSKDASIDDIRKRYYGECRKYHPDKVVKEVGHRVCVFETGQKGIIREANLDTCKVELENPDGTTVLRTVRTNEIVVELEEYDDKWHALQRAWDTLSNPCRRMTYNWRSRHWPRTDAFREQLLDEIRTAHAIDIANSQKQYDTISEQERRQNGLVVLQAWYGDLQVATSVRPVPLSDAASFRGPVLDVTTAVQCLVDNHKIIVPAGSQSRKSKLSGFQWLPIDRSTGATSLLYVFYSYRGRLHETTVGETDTLMLPQRRHGVQIHNGPTKPSVSPARSRRGSADEDGRIKRFAERHYNVLLFLSCGMLAVAAVGLLRRR